MPTTSTNADPNRYQCFEYSIRLYEIFGFFTETPSKTWKQRLFYFIPWCSWTWFTASLILNFALLISKYFTESNFAIRGTEIFQRGYEVFLAPLLLFELHSFVHHCYKLVLDMRKNFLKHPDIPIQRQEKTVILLSTIIIESTMICSYYRKLVFGLPPEEIELAAYYYNKAKPERQLPFIFWFPFDDTLNPFYYFALVINFYLMLIAPVLALHANTCILIFAIHLQGQYLILAKYLENIGNPQLFEYRHVNIAKQSSGPSSRQSGTIASEENIRKTTTGENRRGDNEETNSKNTTKRRFHTRIGPKLSSNAETSFVQDSHEHPSRILSGSNRNPNMYDNRKDVAFESGSAEDRKDEDGMATFKLAIAQGRNFERDCLAWTIKRHQYLIRYRNKLQETFKIIILCKICSYIVVVTFSLYQLSFVKEFNMYAFQLILQLLVTLSFAYVVNYSSEMIEEGNLTLHKAAYTNLWYKSLNVTRAGQPGRRTPHLRMLIVLIRMCNRSTRFVYYGESINICYRSFLTILRFCYSIFALMKRSIHVH